VGETGSDGGGDAAVDMVHTDVRFEIVEVKDDATLRLLVWPRTGDLAFDEIWLGAKGVPGLRREEVRGGIACPLGSATPLETTGDGMFGVLVASTCEFGRSSAGGNGQQSPSP